MNERLNVLLIEDSEDDALLVIRELKRGQFHPNWQRIQTEADLTNRLETSNWDVIIADYRLPGFDAPAALKVVQQSLVDIPFIVISGTIGEAAAVGMMRAGAHDYLMKDNLTRLSEAIRRELRDAQVRRERRQTEARSKLQLTAIEASIDGIAILQEGNFIYLNHSYHQLFGYDHSTDLVGKSWRGLYSPETVQWFEREVFPQLGLELAWQGEAIATRKNGSTFVQEISLTLAEDGVMIAVCRDITARKQAEERLKHLNTDLLRSNQELGQFAYVASHDLQEPLRKIRSFSELLSTYYQGQLDERADRYIGYITNGAERMQGLISDLLSYSRVGRAELNMQATSLESILQQVKDDLETVIRTRNALISFDTLPTVYADPTQVRRLMQNLLSNAIKYCQADIPRVYIGATQGDRGWTISVQDNGIGINPQFSERIFVIFQRLHNRDEYSGTGIGLAICKKIVDRHGGQIWVDSQEGQGSTFSFTLPNSCEISLRSLSSSHGE